VISVLILTFNEEANIEACIGSLPWRSDVRILDSFSSDQTAEIGRQLGAYVETRKFDGYASQRNAGLSLAFENEWIVMLDADERMTPELATEIEREIERAGDDVAMFRVRRRDMFLGRWLKRSSGYPTWFPRIIRRGRVRVEREINEIYVPDGAARQLQGHIDHFPFNKGMDWWFERHNRYSAMEAQLLVNRSDRISSDINSTDPGSRRAALKAFAYRLPLRPYLVFFYLYFVRGGFLDGKPGWVYANMRLAYEIMIDAKAAYSKAEQ
jgi:glycosyltransferase involved in cell wall biosynthesis